MEDMGIKVSMGPTLDFWQGRRVLVTGHTGFKGAWLCEVLLLLGADVTGYALSPESQPNMYELCDLESRMSSIIGDIRNMDILQDVFLQTQPEVVVHMAAQPLVGAGYDRPHYTYETNVMGTVNVLECIRQASSVRSFLNVTTDKVYLNSEDPERWYSEEDRLDGFDPYSNSKSCSELVTAAYSRSFFSKQNLAISTARSGNVIGGGDYSKDRILPDCVRAATSGEPIILRNPNSTRPYQHVLEPISAYLKICEAQVNDIRLAGSYNVGPDEKSCITTGKLADLFCSIWGEGSSWKREKTDGPHEANYLALDASKITEFLGWKPKWGIREAVAKTVEGYKAISGKGDVPACMIRQIQEYFKD